MTPPAIHSSLFVVESFTGDINMFLKLPDYKHSIFSYTSQVGVELAKVKLLTKQKTMCYHLMKYQMRIAKPRSFLFQMLARASNNKWKKKHRKKAIDQWNKKRFQHLISYFVDVVLYFIMSINSIMFSLVFRRPSTNFRLWKIFNSVFF